MVGSVVFGAKMSAIGLWLVMVLVLAPAGMHAVPARVCEESCGETTVKYPFGLESGCGDQQFEKLLSCVEEDRLVFNAGSDQYDVRIDYETHTVSINDTSLLNCSTLQGPPPQNFKVPASASNILFMTTKFIIFSNEGFSGGECGIYGDANFTSPSCGDDRAVNWNATVKNKDSNFGSLVSHSPLCLSKSGPWSGKFCITSNLPDGTVSGSYSSIILQPLNGEDGKSHGLSKVVCSPTIQFSYDAAFNSPSPSPSPSPASKLGVILAGVAAGAAGIACSALCFLILRHRGLKFWKGRRSNGYPRRNLAIIMNAGSGSSSGPTRFSYKELATATKNFAEEGRIGGGGFSVVYKGKLKDGRQVAVKKLHQANLQGRQQFMAELMVLSQAKHANLVRLYGCCPEERILVYEYVKNGTLAESLHGSRTVPFLNCRTRLSIAVEVAEALAYLHSLHPPIVHRDVKSSNILLDEGFRAKVGDFGLSRLHDVERTHVSTAPQGTPGYLDPDYHQSYHLSDKSDVYSLGVVLMELISGKKAVDMNRERGEVNLSALAASRIQSGAVEELLQPRLARTASEKDAITELAEVGFQCLATEKDDRPSMQEVVMKIKAIQYRAFAFPTPTLSPLVSHETIVLIKSKSQDWVPSESYPGLDVELQGR